MTVNWQSRSWQFWMALSLVLSSATVAGSEKTVLAQIIPDGTLGEESSTVMPLNGQADRIDGGATRGSNLFHSFQEFNINEGRGAYFANPAVIENIFSRITGSNPSHLLGTLGVLGNANLFFLNPNGIIFGPNAKLDLRGSLVTSTANSLLFPDGNQFSATNPEAAPLLTIDVPVPIGLQFEGEEPGAMINAGNLEAGGNLTLVGGTVASTGQLLTLEGEVAVSTVSGVDAEDNLAVLQLGESGQILGQEIQLLAGANIQSDTSVLSWSELVADGVDQTGLTVNGEGTVELTKSGTTVSVGDIAVGQLIAQGAKLSANHNLTLVESQLGTVGDLTLLAQDTVRVRDSVDHPFIAAAGGKLLVQGNQGVDIFALNHPDSGLFSGGDLVLRSAQPVGGDAHYWSGGNFQIEQLDGSLGDLSSLYDPVIRSLGDVSFFAYGGASLHILAGGSVNIGTVLITGSDPAGETINPTTTPTLANVTLSDGNPIVINGSTRPTLDVRAGMDPTTIGDPLGTVGEASGIFVDPSLSPVLPTANNPIATSADITIGNIAIAAPNSLIFITNQYQPNPSLSAGDITVNGIDALFNSVGDGGNVILDSRGSIALDGAINASTNSGNGGDVTLLAEDNITTGSSILANGLLGGNVSITSSEDVSLTNGASVDVTAGGGGSITVNAKNIEISGGSTLVAGIGADLGTSGAQAGDIEINATEKVKIEGQANSRSQIFNSVGNEEVGGYTAKGNAGDVVINTNSFEGIGNYRIGSATFGQGDAGRVTITASKEVTLNGKGFGSGATSAVGPLAVGKANGIIINTPSLSLSNVAQLATSTLGQGNAGNIQVKASESISVDNSVLQAITAGSGNAGNIIIEASNAAVSFDGVGTAASTSVAVEELLGFVFVGTGQGGDIIINARTLNVKNGAQLFTSTFGPVGTEGLPNAGNILVNVLDSVTLSGSSQLSSSTRGQGNAGNVTISAWETVSFDDSSAFSTVGEDAVGNGGSIEIRTDKLSLINGASLSTTSFGQGDAGSVMINATDTVSFDGSSAFSRVRETGVGKAGSIDIQARSLTFINGASLSTTSFGQGDAGSVMINATDTVSFDGSSAFSTLEETGVGDGGSIGIQARSLTLINGASLSTNSLGQGNAGSVSIEATDTVSLVNGSGIDAFTLGKGDGGQVTIRSGNSVTLSGVLPPSDGGISSRVVTSAEEEGSGQGGSILINTPHLKILDGAVITARSRSELQGGGIIEVNAETLELRGGGQMLTTTFRGGDAGRININVSDRIEISGSDPTFSERFNQVAEDLGEETARFNIDPVSSESGLFANTEDGSRGNGGNISINSNTVIIDNRAQIAVNSDGSGVGGDINIFSGSLNLDNGGEISAETISTDGGNITLQINDKPLLLHNLSKISTTAGDEEFGGNGGNIIINAPFILAYPSENSDITANAFEGNGGNINITTNALFGIEFRDQETKLSDITASSEFGQQGEVEINTSGIDPTRGLLTLPEETVNTEISQGCQTVRGREAVEYFEIGRGGLSPTPDEPLNSDGALEDWIDLEPKSDNGSDSGTTINSAHSAKTQLISPCPAQ